MNKFTRCDIINTARFWKKMQNAQGVYYCVYCIRYVTRCQVYDSLGQQK